MDGVEITSVQTAPLSQSEEAQTGKPRVLSRRLTDASIPPIIHHAPHHPVEFHTIASSCPFSNNTLAAS